MGAIGDGQASDEYTVSICAKDSSGPYHYALTQHLVGLSKKDKIPYKLDIYPYYGSDASAAIRAGFDVKHALFGPGIESSHALERTHVDSLKATASIASCIRHIRNDGLNGGVKWILKKLFEILPVKQIEGVLPPTITDLAIDSRAVSAGGVFVCIEGYTVDGHDYVEKAVENGARVIVASKPVDSGLGKSCCRNGGRYIEGN